MTIDKAVAAEDGRWLLHGPAALVDEEDFDGDILDKSAVSAGLVIFRRLGGQVDWEHQYRKTMDPSFLIGKCVDTRPNPGGGADLVTTELFQDAQKPLAKAAWDHKRVGGYLGYSLQGLCKARDPKAQKRVTGLDIHLMTLTPNPKGFEGPGVSMGMPSLGAVVKSLMAGELDNWQPVKAATFVSLPSFVRVPETPPVIPPVPADRLRVCRANGELVREITDPDTVKALMAGSGVVQIGTSSGAALRTQSLLGGVPSASSDGTARRKRKKKAREKAREKAAREVEKAAREIAQKRREPVNKALVAALTAHGSAHPETLARMVSRQLSGVP